MKDVIKGDIWDMPGVKIVSTNLGGIHGRGLAKQAKDMGLITSSNFNFASSPKHGKVICIAVKGNAPETARIRGKAFSERTTAGNLQLLAAELDGLIQLARSTPDTNYYLPFVGLGFGEGDRDAILPLLLVAASEPNVFLIARNESTTERYADSFLPGIRRDASSR